MITSPPWILQYNNSAGSVEWSSLAAGMETLIQVGSLGRTACSAVEMNGLSVLVVSAVLERETGQDTFSAMTQGKREVGVGVGDGDGDATQSAEAGTREIRLSWRRGGGALHCVPLPLRGGLAQYIVY